MNLNSYQRRDLYPTMGANTTQVGGSHYKKQKIQHWDIVVANDIPYLEACAMKYIMRHKDKGKRQDLEKAIHYLEKAIEVNYPRESDREPRFR